MALFREDFVVILPRENDVEKIGDFFMKHGAKEVKVSYDYVTVDDDPNSAVTFFITGMTWIQSIFTRLELGLQQIDGLPKSHYTAYE